MKENNKGKEMAIARANVLKKQKLVMKTYLNTSMETMRRMEQIRRMMVVINNHVWWTARFMGNHIITWLG